MRPTATGRVLRDPRTGASFHFDAGAVSLDFAHTGGDGPFAVFETLHTPADLSRWVADSPLRAAVSLKVTERGLRDAKQLRQAIWDAAQAAAAGRRVPARAVATINAAAARPPLVPVMSARARHQWAPPIAMSQVLSELAREAIAVLTGPLAERLRTCASDDCPLVFVDWSRPNSRRWCSMERCGNRQKVRSLRARRQDAAPPSTAPA